MKALVLVFLLTACHVAPNQVALEEGTLPTLSFKNFVEKRTAKDVLPAVDCKQGGGTLVC